MNLIVGMVYYLEDYTAPKVFNGLCFECLLTDQKIPSNSKITSEIKMIEFWDTTKMYQPERFYELTSHKLKKGDMYQRSCVDCGNQFESDRRHQNVCLSCISQLPEKVVCMTCEEKAGKGDQIEVPREEIAMIYEVETLVEYECYECQADFIDSENQAKH